MSYKIRSHDGVDDIPDNYFFCLPFISYLFLAKLSKARFNKKPGLSLFTFESKALWQPPLPKN